MKFLDTADKAQPKLSLSSSKTIDNIGTLSRVLSLLVI